MSGQPGPDIAQAMYGRRPKNKNRIGQAAKITYFRAKEASMTDRNLLLDIARHYGTPAYVYDLQDVRERYLHLKEHLTGLPADVHYAVKANAHPEILRTLREMGSGADCVSVQEVERVLEAGFAPEKVLYTPSCPSEEELRRAFELGVRVHIGALEYLPWVAEHYPGRPIGLRLNPDVRIEGNVKIATAHAGSKFGIPWTLNKDLMKMLRKLPLRVTGLHVHIGSDVHSWQDLARGVDFLTDIAGAFPDLTYLDFGSGLKVPYRKSEREIDLAAYADHIRQRMKALPQLRIVLEPGKFLVARSGVFLMQVTTVKRTPFKTFAGVNTGFNHMIRPMYYDAYHAIENLSNPGGKEQVYDVVGNLCEEDTFARARRMPEVRKGDILALHNAGAYGYVMASHYNLRPLPKEIIVDGNKIYEA